MSMRLPPPPGSMPLAAALDRSEPLGQLLRRLQRSRALFDVVRPLLPPGLQATVRPGPLDDEGWTLLAPHGAAAAKLRQLLPRFEQALQASAGAGTAPRIIVRVQPPA